MKCPRNYILSPNIMSFFIFRVTPASAMVLRLFPDLICVPLQISTR